VKVLLSDLFSTLIPGGKDERAVVTRAVAELLGVEPGDFARELDATSYERFTGAYGDSASALRVVAERAGGAPDPESLQKATELRAELSRRLLEAVPATTLAALATLRAAGWRIGLVSNATAETVDEWPASRLAPYVDTTAFSVDVGAAKPDPAIYLTACAALDAAPTDCVYLGDGENNELPTAKALGMHAIRTREHADNHPTWPGPTVNSFAELPGLVG
jgi:putative hydrolase of the HAD superfamily